MIPVLKVAEPTWVPRLLHGAYAEAEVVQVKVHSTSRSAGAGTRLFPPLPEEGPCPEARALSLGPQHGG